MTLDRAEIRGLIKNAAPAPFDETNEYKLFTTSFSKHAIFWTISLSYILSFAFQNSIYARSELILTVLPVLRGRFLFLEAHDNLSAVTFLGVALCGLLLCPLLTVASFLGFQRHVLLGRHFKRVNLLTTALLFLVGAIAIGLFWTAFVDVPSDLNAGHIGMTHVFFWPIFPALGGAVVFLLSQFAFLFLAAIAKAALQFRELHD